MKKVIAYMTLGIDVSRLFTDMMMVLHSLVPKTLLLHLIICRLSKQEIWW